MKVENDNSITFHDTSVTRDAESLLIHVQETYSHWPIFSLNHPQSVKWGIATDRAKHLITKP